jgi:hypothetical protein
VKSFLAFTSRNQSAGRSALDTFRCTTVLEMSYDELTAFRGMLCNLDMAQTVTIDDLVAKARLYWEEKGIDADSVLADAIAASGGTDLAETAVDANGSAAVATTGTAWLWVGLHGAAGASSSWDRDDTCDFFRPPRCRRQHSAGIVILLPLS